MEYPQRDSADAPPQALREIATWEAWRYATDAVAILAQSDGTALLKNAAFDRLWAAIDAEPESIAERFGAELQAAGTDTMVWLSVTVAAGQTVRVGMLRLPGSSSAVLVTIPSCSVSPPDAVTGLADRRQLEDDLKRRFRSGRPFALAFVDLDGFKQVNDDLGHVAGDLALREIAQRMRALLREHDTVSRYGGDEFVVLLDGTFDLIALSQIGERLRNAAATPLDSVNGASQLSASIGWATSDENFPTPAEMVSAADQRMYDSKRQSC
ncbi:Response regulator PleD [Posidoniimonas polymericola]|uniref:Response regulator PleD n=1 Tax=Posidoniimonas polymericola TaxID=2528002 RepID=A0A5C5XWC0_9BACT|nr:GGDEF domain-containing protein [Posidoniimonas polymericola]TWT67627.1 Response regulator PleD [Posidoniimonas polymericola]